jgi:hypothetical protein
MPDINIGTFSMDHRKWSHVVGLPPEKWSSLK